MREWTKWRVFAYAMAFSGVVVLPMLTTRADGELRQVACLLLAGIAFATAAILEALDKRP